MKVQRYFSHSMQDALRLVREDMGPDAVILSNTKMDGGIEILATLEYDEQASEQSVSELAGAGGQPSASHIARVHAEKSMKLQREMERAKSKITSVREKAERSRSAKPEFKANTQTVTGIKRELEGMSSGSQSFDPIRDMQAQISELKTLISEQSVMRQGAPADQKTVAQQQAQGMLESLCIAKPIQESLLASIARETNSEHAWAKIRKQVHGAISADYSEFIDHGGVVALVGPTGSGKTMTIGKLAARYVMKYGAESIALVTTDRYRIAAHEQLKVFGRILNVPVHVVDEDHCLDSVLDELSDRRLVLIDTAGLMHTDRSWTEQLQELKMSAHNVQNYLVVPAVGQYQVMCSNYNHYKMVGLAGTIVTKVDEAVSLGETLSFLIDTRLTAAYYTDGQRVPEDIHKMDKELLINKAEALLNSSERWVTISGQENSSPTPSSLFSHSA